MRTYRNMKSRVTGIQKKKYHLYSHCELLEKSLFYVWSKSNPDFLKLYDAWVKAEYDRKLSPSIDRIDSEKGYTLDNMQWITHSENSGKITNKNRIRNTSNGTRSFTNTF